MITQEQKQIWREEYLEELRRISQTPETIGGEVDLFDDVDESILEEHLFHYYFSLFLPFLKSIVFVLKNHPIAVANIDKDWIKQSDSLSCDELFEYLVALTRYGQERFLSDTQTTQTTRDFLFDALQRSDKTAFLEILTKENINFTRECLQVGYAQMLYSFVENQYTSMLSILEDENDVDDEDQINALMEKGESFAEERIGQGVKNVMCHPDDMPDVLQLSKLSLDQVEPECKDMYFSLVVQMSTIKPFVDEYFDQEEKEIIYNCLNNKTFTDIEEDISSLQPAITEYLQTRNR